MAKFSQSNEQPPSSSKQSEKLQDELGKVLKSVKDSPLKSKVAKFADLAKGHKETQEKNPFSEHSDAMKNPKLDVSTDEYGRYFSYNIQNLTDFFDYF